MVRMNGMNDAGHRPISEAATKVAGTESVDETTLREFERLYHQEAPPEKKTETRSEKYPEESRFASSSVSVEERNQPASSSVSVEERNRLAPSSVSVEERNRPAPSSVSVEERNRPAPSSASVEERNRPAFSPDSGELRTMTTFSADPKTGRSGTVFSPDPGAEQNSVAPLSDPEKKDEAPGLSSLMSSLFSERLGVSSIPTTPATSVDVAAPAPRMATAEMVGQLVDQILVSHPDQLGEQEVRLMVKNSVLPDTEIRLSRGTDGLLNVTLTTGRNDAFQTLVDAQTELKQILDAQEKREVRITVVDARGAEAEDGGRDRRSRSHAAYMSNDDDVSR
jgi:type III secretion system needle length determinant